MCCRGIGTAAPADRYTKAECLFAFQESAWFTSVEPRRAAPDSTRTRNYCRIRSSATALLTVIGKNGANQAVIDEIDASRKLPIAVQHAT